MFLLLAGLGISAASMRFSERHVKDDYADAARSCSLCWISPRSLGGLQILPARHITDCSSDNSSNTSRPSPAISWFWETFRKIVPPAQARRHRLLKT